METFVLRLSFGGHLASAVLLSYFARRAIPGVEQVAGGFYRRTIAIDGEPGLLELQPRDASHLVLHAHLPGQGRLEEVKERARRIFGLDADLEGAVAHLRGDETIGPRVAASPGLRVPGTWDAFETGVRAIVGQQVSVGGATTIAGRIAERHGTAVPRVFPAGLTHTFPPAATLAAADLTGLGLTTARQRAIGAFAGAVADDEIRLDSFHGLDQLVTSITAIRGLGPWTAHYIALRVGEPDAFPASDLGLRRAAGGSVPLAAATLAERAERWRPWRGLAAAHLWMTDPVELPAR